MPSAEEQGVTFGRQFGIRGTDPDALAALRALTAEQVTDNLDFGDLSAAHDLGFAKPAPTMQEPARFVARSLAAQNVPAYLYRQACVPDALKTTPAQCAADLTSAAEAALMRGSKRPDASAPCRHGDQLNYLAAVTVATRAFRSVIRSSSVCCRALLTVLPVMLLRSASSSAWVLL